LLAARRRKRGHDQLRRVGIPFGGENMPPRPGTNLTRRDLRIMSAIEGGLTNFSYGNLEARVGNSAGAMSVGGEPRLEDCEGRQDLGLQ